MTQQQRTFDSIVEREKGLRRGLGSGQMAMIAIGGAIGTGLFLGSGFAVGLAGPGVLVSYAIGALIALLLMGALAEMTVVHPTAGSFGAYAEHYVGPLAGFLVRYAYWFAVVFAIGTEISAIAVFMKYWFPAVPGWYWVVAFSAVLIAVNMASVTLYGVVEYAFSLLKIAAIVVFIVLGAYLVWSAPAGSTLGLANYTAHGGFFPKGGWGVWVAVIVAIFSYMSIETVALSAMNSQLYVTSRMMFSLSRAGLAPAVFGRVRANGVPLAALLVSTSGVAVATVLVARYPETAFTLMMAIAMFGALFTWLMIFVTHLFFRARYRGPAPAFRMWLHPVGSLLGGALVAAILATTAFTREFGMTMKVGVAFIVLLTLAYQFHYRTRHIR